MPSAVAHNPATLKPGKQKAPRDAFRMRVPVEMQFAAGDGKVTQATVKILARTAEPIEHWYWGTLVHDMAGMMAKDRVPLDWCHWWDINVGYADQLNADSKNGLTVTGQVISTRDDDQAAEIIARGRAGVPYEASIDWTGGKRRIEYLGQGMTAEVNGRTVEGPAVIFREWELKAIAICPFGADPGTETQFANRNKAAGDEPAELDVDLLTEPHMATNPNPAPASESKPAAAAAPAPTESPEAAFATKLAAFTAEFGEVNGSKWAAAGKTHEEALKLHAEGLATQLKAADDAHNAGDAAKDKEIDELKAKLAAIPRGEAVASGGDGEKPSPAAASKHSKLGKNLSRFAAGIKVPALK